MMRRFRFLTVFTANFLVYDTQRIILANTLNRAHFAKTLSVHHTYSLVRQSIRLFAQFMLGF